MAHVPVIGVTGHMDLPEATRVLVAGALRATLAPYGAGEFRGATCLARGADRIFAHVVLELGGAVDVVLPAADYRDAIVKDADRPEFDDLLARAATVTTLPFRTSSRAAYLAASREVIDRSDLLVAVWDGRAADGSGGTSDAVALAVDAGTPVTVVWPPSAARTS
ncbi:hypothetical protein [Jiangella mangrovi]|uniref:DUF1273 family protein n=1 Tax=Jiangella mangrovi TaxID=1524084 RepID=A0A7W9GMQ0_9ACTN|nr:hypothetical protein [Jiangella mangrovi]MBB5786532.1 hypothetical protein [Jiangella mangrovi]